jgi:glutamyl-tRNA reductase
MGIVLIGVSHKTAPVETRERLAFAESTLPGALREIVDHQTISESLIVSTCNRVEILAATPGADAEETERSIARLYDFIHRHHGCARESFNGHFYHHADLDAIRHVFRVASSLDSMVVGEPQILGQVKEAFHRAQEAQTVGHTLNRLMSRAFAVAKRVRNETGIASSAVSISFVAVELARKVFEELTGLTVLLIGAGEMAELAARHLINYGASRILIANRTYENAERLAQELNGAAIRFEETERRLPEADIIICSTGAPHYLIRQDQARRALDARRNRPMLMVDISVPRNIDPVVSELDNVFAFDIDDLEAVTRVNLQEREREALRAEAIIETEAEHFAATLTEGDINAVIGAFRREIGALALSEFERSRKRLGPLTAEQEEAIRIMLNAVVNKFTHPIIKQLRESEEGHSAYLDAFRELYHHDDQKRNH